MKPMLQAEVHALIVDDSRAMRAILRRILVSLGFNTTEASDGVEGLEKLEILGDIDIALVDWNMPKMNGYEFVKSVRSEIKYNDMWLMMVTTETEMSRVVRAMAAGANEYVMKPFTDEVIAEKMKLLGLVSI